MTAAALPLLTAGTLLSTTDAANATTQNGRRHDAERQRQRRSHPGQDPRLGRDQDGQPASLDIWKGDAGKVDYTVNVTKHDGQLGAVSLRPEPTTPRSSSATAPCSALTLRSTSATRRSRRSTRPRPSPTTLRSRAATAARSAARTARSRSPSRDQPPPGPGAPDASRSRPASVIAYRGTPRPLPPASARPSCSSFFSHRSVVIWPDSEPSSSRVASRLDTPPGRARSISNRSRVLQVPRHRQFLFDPDFYTNRNVSCAKREGIIIGESASPAS